LRKTTFNMGREGRGMGRKDRDLDEMGRSGLYGDGGERD